MARAVKEFVDQEGQGEFILRQGSLLNLHSDYANRYHIPLATDTAFVCIPLPYRLQFVPS